MFTLIRNWFFQTYFRIKRPMTLGARIIAINDKNQVCLIKHTYTKGWHLPGGGVEKGETIFDTAIKELHEEAGLLTKIEDLSLLSFHSNFNNFKGDHVAILLTRNWVLSPVNNSHEIAQTGFFSLDNLPIDTTKGTKNRLYEYFNNMPPSPYW